MSSRWDRRTPREKARRTTRSRAGSVNSRSQNVLHRSSKATWEPISSITSTTGGRPASTGCSRSSRWAKAWSVPMAARRGRRWPAGSARRRRRRRAGLGGRRRARPDPVAQLGGGLLGERDGGGGGEVVAGLDEGHEPAHQRGGLARARSGLHEQRGVEGGGDRAPGPGIGEGRFSHGRPPGGRRGPGTRPSRGRPLARPLVPPLGRAGAVAVARDAASARTATPAGGGEPGSNRPRCRRRSPRCRPRPGGARPA